MKVNYGSQSTSLISWFWTACVLLALFTGSVPAGDTGGDGASPSPDDSNSINSDPIEKSVVKIVSTVRYPDYYKPWNQTGAHGYQGHWCGH